MSVPRHAIVALLVGLVLLASTPVLLQFEEPRACANAVEPLEGAAVEESLPEVQYGELSPTGQRAFDTAQTASGSAIVTGEDCPQEFTYSVSRERYVVVKDDSRYVLTTYLNDLLPQVTIAVGALGFLAFTLLGVGVASRRATDAWFPEVAAAVALVTLVAVSGTIALGQGQLAAIAWTLLLTALTLVGAGATLEPREGLLVIGIVSVLLATATFPLGGVSVALLAPAAVPLVLVGSGILIGRLVDVVTDVAKRESST